jgi:hypothetical protein
LGGGILRYAKQANRLGVLSFLFLFLYNLPLDSVKGDLGGNLPVLFCVDRSRAGRNSAGEFLKALWTMYMMNSGWDLVGWSTTTAQVRSLPIFASVFDIYLWW